MHYALREVYDLLFRTDYAYLRIQKCKITQIIPVLTFSHPFRLK